MQEVLMRIKILNELNAVSRKQTTSNTTRLIFLINSQNVEVTTFQQNKLLNNQL